MEAALEEMERSARLSQSTKKMYDTYLRRLYGALGEREADAASVAEFVEKTYGPPMRPNTKRLAIIIFNTWVLKPKGLTPLRVPKKDRSAETKRNHFTKHELSLLLEYSGSVDSQLYHCIRVAVATGMRIREILGLTCREVLDAAISMPEGEGKVVEIKVRRGKGGKSRSVMVAASESDYFRYELPKLTQHLGPDEKIFHTKYDNMLYKLKAAMNHCGIFDQQHRGFHGMRSHFCTRVMSGYKEKNYTYAENVLQQLMGHSNFSTTREYVRPGREELVRYALGT